MYSEDYRESGAKPSELDLLCDDLLQTGDLEKRPDGRGRYCWGTGIKRAVFYQGDDYAPVDLFQVIEPRQWGVIFAIRTGPGDFNRLLVTNRLLGGACHADRKVAGGRVWSLMACSAQQRYNIARMPATKFLQRVKQGAYDVDWIPTPAEEDFFRTLDVPYWPPEERTLQRLRTHLRQTAGRERHERP